MLAANRILFVVCALSALGADSSALAVSQLPVKNAAACAEELSPFHIEVFHTEKPEQIETLPKDVIAALHKVNAAYVNQPTNTFDVFKEQALLEGRQVTYLIGKDAAGEVQGMLAVIFASNRFPTNVARFGVRDDAPVQIELGRFLVLVPGGKLFTKLLRAAVVVLKDKKLPADTPVYFWADEPTWATKLKRMNATEVPIQVPGIWAFREPLLTLFEKYQQR